MALRLRIAAAAVALLALGGCSSSAPAGTPASEAPETASGEGHPVLAPGTVVATGEFSGDPRVTGRLSVVIGATGDYELHLASFVAASGVTPQLQVLADDLPVDGDCIDSDWRFGLGAVTSSEQTFVLGGSDDIGQGDLSFLREIAVTQSGASADSACPLPFIAHAPLDWTLPDMRPGLSVADSGAAVGAAGDVVLQGREPLSYTVAAGDSLTAIAARFGIELDELFYLNPTRSPNPEGSTAFTGEVLNLSREDR
jgi:LysM repeat protein